MKKIRIQPFPNFGITEDAIKRDVEGNLSKKASKISNDILVVVNKYNDGEKRMNFVVPDKKNGKTFLAVFPDPIQLYYSQALTQFNISEELRNKNFVQGAKKLKDQEEYLLDSNSDNTSQLYNTYLQLRIGAIIMLACSIEAFVNSIIPNGVSYTSEKGEELDKYEIQRFLSLKEKIEKVLPLTTGRDIKAENKLLIDRINSLSRVRNEFVHLKNYNDSPASDSYHKLFKDMQNFDIKEHLRSVKDYMNEYKPGFIVEEK